DNGPCPIAQILAVKHHHNTAKLVQIIQTSKLQCRNVNHLIRSLQKISSKSKKTEAVDIVTAYFGGGDFRNLSDDEKFKRVTVDMHMNTSKAVMETIMHHQLHPLEFLCQIQFVDHSQDTLFKAVQAGFWQFAQKILADPRFNYHERLWHRMPFDDPEKMKAIIEHKVLPLSSYTLELVVGAPSTKRIRSLGNFELQFWDRINHSIVHRLNSSKREEDCLEVVRMICRNGVEITDQVFAIAAVLGRASIVNTLMSLGGVPGPISLHAALYANRYDIMETLLNHIGDAVFEPLDERYDLPFPQNHKVDKFLPAASKLINAGVYKRDFFWTNVLEGAHGNELSEVFWSLIHAGAKFTPHSIGRIFFVVPSDQFKPLLEHALSTPLPRDQLSHLYEFNPRTEWIAARLIEYGVPISRAGLQQASMVLVPKYGYREEREIELGTAAYKAKLDENVAFFHKLLCHYDAPDIADDYDMLEHIIHEYVFAFPDFHPDAPMIISSFTSLVDRGFRISINAIRRATTVFAEEPHLACVVDFLFSRASREVRLEFISS
ncbi:hypothetical protein HDV05_007443, partial [Chytridiales sp. JEL 0842]